MNPTDVICVFWNLFTVGFTFPCWRRRSNQPSEPRWTQCILGISFTASSLWLDFTKVSISESDANPHQAAGVADARQLGRDVLPDADAALADALPGRQFHEEERNAHNQQKENVQQHEGPWRDKRNLLFDFIYFNFSEKRLTKKGTSMDYSGHWETLTSSVLVAEVRKPPDVAQADAESHLGQHILDLWVPRWTVLIGRLGSVSVAGSGQLAFGPALCQPAAALRAVQWCFLSLGANKGKKKITERLNHFCFRRVWGRTATPLQNVAMCNGARVGGA